MVMMIDHLKEKILEEVGRIHNGENEDGGKVDCEDGIQDSSLEDQGHLDSFIPVSGVDICEGPKMLKFQRNKCKRAPVGDDVLREDSLRVHVEEMGGDRHHRGLQFPHDEVDSTHLRGRNTHHHPPFYITSLVP